MSRDSELTAEPAVRVRAQRREQIRSRSAVLLVIAVGGGSGALARYGVTELLPTRTGHFPWGTFVVNGVGCLLIGALMVLIGEMSSAHRLVRPFLGVGFLGGFTTFSTYAVETDGLMRAGAPVLAFGYWGGTVLCAMLAVILGVWLTRAVGSVRNRGRT